MPCVTLAKLYEPREFPEEGTEKPLRRGLYLGNHAKSCFYSKLAWQGHNCYKYLTWRRVLENSKPHLDVRYYWPMENATQLRILIWPVGLTALFCLFWHCPLSISQGRPAFRLLHLPMLWKQLFNERKQMYSLLLFGEMWNQAMGVVGLGNVFFGCASQHSTVCFFCHSPPPPPPLFHESMAPW